MSKFRKRLCDNAGFTLIELLVVIAVLGILAGITVPRLTGVRDKAKYSAGQTALQTIRNYANMYFTENATGASLDTIVSEYTDQTSGSALLSEGWSFNQLPDPIATSSSIIIEQSGLDNLTLDLSKGTIE